MEQKRWTDVLSRITPQDADDLDDLAGPFDARRRAPGRDLFPAFEGAGRNTNFKLENAVCVGVRVTAPLSNSTEQAMRLAAFALERDVEIVLLSMLDATGLERFGFRVERVPSEAAGEAYELQVRQFWNIDLVL
jgi:hypothetical protein